MKLMKVLLLSSFICFFAGCAKPTAPSVNPNPAYPITGRLTSTQAGTPVAGATVSSSKALNSVLTDASGAYRIEGSLGLWSIGFEAAGFVPRRTHFNLVNPTAGLNVTAISLAPPFSLEYYREAVRGARDHPGQMFALSRWTQAPRFFFLTRTLDAGDAVPDAVIDKMQEFAVRLTPPLTGGKFVVAQMERGPAPPASINGWIIVESYTNGIPDAPNAGGDSWVGINPGRIRLLFRPQLSGALCGFRMAGAFFHEIVHALGYWHVAEGFSVDNDCGQLMPALEYHAAIAYQRPAGNIDPDVDQQYFTPTAVVVR
jgi:hypothetical protein